MPATANEAKTQVDRLLASLGRTHVDSEILAADVTLTFMDTGESFDGRQAVIEMLDSLHRHAFDAASIPLATRASGRHVMVEAEFRGTQTAAFAGILPAATPVISRYALAVDLDDDGIRAIRAYWALDTLVRQLRGGRL